MLADCRVLVVEDDEYNRELISLVLGDEGCEVWTARTGREALSLLHEARPHVIVLDLRLPDMDGWAFRTAQRQNGFADVPVLILTAVANPEQHAEALGASVLAKPFDLDDLLASIQHLLLNQTSRR
jgi:sigma-B regulation protein RsbU (phosphoserine phosphatase)